MASASGSPRTGTCGNVYVSGEDIRFQDGLDTPVSDGDEVTILPAVAGG
jgi:sulfur-carrier protein